MQEAGVADMIAQDKQERRSTAPKLEEAALVMAVSIVVERISTLPDDDKNDVFELLKELRSVRTRDELESLVGAFLEILEQEPMTARTLDFDDAQPMELKKWIQWVSRKIRDARKAAKMTQVQLAAKAGLPQSHISRLERGQHSPSRTTLEKIAAALGVAVDIFDPSAD